MQITKAIAEGLPLPPKQPRGRPRKYFLDGATKDGSAKPAAKETSEKGVAKETSGNTGTKEGPSEVLGGEDGDVVVASAGTGMFKQTFSIPF